MLLDALKKVNNSLNSTSKSLLNEDLKSVLNIHHFGLNEALNIANTGNKLSDPVTYLKFKLIDSVKDLVVSKKIFSYYFKEQLGKIDEAIKNPLVRKEFLINNVFKPKNDENYLKAETFADISTIHKEGMKEAQDLVISSMLFDNSLGVKTKILNPFNNIVFDLEMQTDREHSNHGNRVITIENSYHDINSLYVVQLKINSDASLNVSADEKYNKLMNFEYVLYHELAHTSYNQMTKIKASDETAKEIHSDLCSIIKMIKNHDLSSKDTLNLCKEIFKKRLQSASTNQYFEKKPTMRVHFTEIGIIDFTSSIAKQMDNIKNLKDNQIGDFVETFIQESAKIKTKILPEIEDKPVFVKNLLDRYLKENIGDDLTKLMNAHIHEEIIKTRFYEKGQFKLKELYTSETTALAYEKIKTNMYDSMMNDENILTDIYMQNKSKEIGLGNFFISEVVKRMPEGKQLGIDAFEQFERYKQFNVNIEPIEEIKTKNKDVGKHKII